MLKLTIQNHATNEIPRQYLDCTKARRTMEWAPKWSIEESLRETVQWYEGWLASSSGEGEEMSLPRVSA